MKIFFFFTAEITVLTPNPKFYGVVNETLPITWTSSGNDGKKKNCFITL
jgi:hypothetical protein